MISEARLVHTREAFDALADGYDRSEESNELLMLLRRQMWRTLLELFPAGSRLLDLGCGTGIDAVFLAHQDRRVLATDLSPRMVACARERAERAGVGARVETMPLAIEALGRLRSERFDGIYADRGPFNCVADLEAVSRNCAQLLPPGGRLVATVIGRVCPWEMVYYALHGDRERAILRMQPGFQPVSLQGRMVPTRYYTPHQFHAAFASYFDLESYRALGLFLPPTYLAPTYRRHRSLGAAARALDAALGGMPGIRNAGDLFLSVLRRRG